MAASATRPSPKPSRRASGDAAESAVVEHLIARGWEILGRNLRLGPLEIDIVARDGRVVCVIEVRRRSSGAWQSPLGSVNRQKQRHIRRAGERLWSRRFKRDPSIDRMRFDVAAVRETDTGLAIEYVRAAF